MAALSSSTKLARAKSVRVALVVVVAVAAVVAVVATAVVVAVATAAAAAVLVAAAAVAAPTVAAAAVVDAAPTVAAAVVDAAAAAAVVATVVVVAAAAVAAAIDPSQTNATRALAGALVHCWVVCFGRSACQLLLEHQTGVLTQRMEADLGPVFLHGPQFAGIFQQHGWCVHRVQRHAV